MNKNLDLNQLLEEGKNILVQLKQAKKDTFLENQRRKQLEETIFFMDNFFQFYFSEINGY